MLVPCSPWHLFLSAWLSNTTHLLGKRNGYERFTFFEHCKKTGRTYHWAIFLTKRMGCSLITIEKNAGEIAEKEVLTKWCLCWAARPKHASKIYTQKKIQNVGVMKRAGWRIQPYHFVRSFFALEPSHSVGFSQGPTFYSYKMVALTPWGEFQPGYDGYVYLLYTISTAQGGGGSFRIRDL